MTLIKVIDKAMPGPVEAKNMNLTKEKEN